MPSTYVNPNRDFQFQGSSVYTPTAPISADVLNTPKLPTLPQPEVPTPIATPTIPSISDILGSTTGDTALSKAFTDSTISTANTSAALAGEPGYRSTQETTYDLSGKRATANDLTNRFNGLKAQAEQIPLQIQQDFQGRGATAGGVAPIQTGQLRENAIQQIGISAMLNAANGNLSTAQDQVEYAVKAKFDPLKAQLAAQQAQLAAITPLLDREDKKRAVAQQTALTERARLIEKAEAEQNNINSVLLTAAQYNADAKTLTKIQNAASYAEAISAAGQYIQDPKAKYDLESARLENQLKLAQIADQKAQTAQRVVETVTAGAPIPSVSDNGQTAVGIKGNVIDAITGLKLTEGQANAVSYSLRMIEANTNLNNRIGDGVTKGDYDPTTTFSALGRVFKSDNARTVDRDLENFIRAQLRKESGAQIADTEMEGGKKIYSPQGILTNNKDIAATKATREQAIQSMIAQAGPAGAYIKQYSQYMSTGGLTPEEQAIIRGGSVTTSTPAVISGIKYF